MALQGTFIGFSQAELTDLRTQFKAAIVAVATAGQSYSISGRTFQRADLGTLRDLLAEINFAYSLVLTSSRVGVTRSVARFESPYHQ